MKLRERKRKRKRKNKHSSEKKEVLDVILEF